MPVSVRVIVTARAPTNPALVQPDTLVYQGALRVPAGVGFEYGGTALAWNDLTQQLIVVGHDWYQQVAAVTLDKPVITDTLSKVPYVRVDQPFRDILGGRLQGEALEGIVTAAKVGGLLPLAGGRLLVSVYRYYDGDGTATISHYTTDRDLSAKTIQGPFRTSWGPGVTGGYMAHVPQALRAELGGPIVTGQGGLSIISRSSCGPALFALDPANLTPIGRVPVTPLLNYPLDHPLDTTEQGRVSPWFNLSTTFGGCVIPEGFRSVLFFGKHGLGKYCYGEATDCGDPAVTSKGGHAFPYAYYVWAYDVTDLAAVRRGERPAWSVRPYAVWSLDLPFRSPNAKIIGAAYDAAGGRIILTAAQTWTPQGDSDRPLIHVFSLKR